MSFNNRNMIKHTNPKMFKKLFYFCFIIKYNTNIKNKKIIVLEIPNPDFSVPTQILVGFSWSLFVYIPLNTYLRAQLLDAVG